MSNSLNTDDQELTKALIDELTKALIDAIAQMSYKEKFNLLATIRADQDHRRRAYVRSFVDVTLKQLLDAPPPITRKAT